MCLMETKNELVEIVKRLGENKLLPGTSGNVSIRYKDNQILLTASGSSSAFVTCDDIILTDFEGNVLEKTDKRPTSEIGIHTLIYKKRSDINAIIHSHSSALSAFAVAQKTLSPILAENIYYFKNIQFVPYFKPGSYELASNTAICFENKDVNACFLSNHGFVLGAKNIKEAFNLTVMAENVAQIELNAQLLGSLKTLDEF